MASPHTLPSGENPQRVIDIKKGKRRPVRVFSGGNEKCGFSTGEYKELCDHREQVHLCKKCFCRCTHILTHKCKNVKLYSELPEVNIQNTSFVERARANNGAIVTLMHIYKEKFVVIRPALESVYNDLFNLVASYIKGYKGIRTKLIFKLAVVELKTDTIFHSILPLCCNSFDTRVVHR